RPMPDERSSRPSGGAAERKARVGLNMSALGSLISSNRRTNARMDRTQFEGAEKELRRVGGEEEVVACYKQAAEREAKVIEKVTNGRMKVAGDRIVVNQATRRSRSRSRSRSGSRAKK
ncbi:Hypothetical protein SCF082_LOCUS30536, partial [Durusdinium trenchii]